MPHKFVQDAFSDQARRTPNAVALFWDDVAHSYQDLELRSNQLAHLLYDLGCRRGDRVCLFQPKGPNAVIGMLGVLKAGAMYVPVDLDSPSERVARIVDAAKPKVVLVDSEGEKLWNEMSQRTESDALAFAFSERAKEDQVRNLKADASHLTAMPHVSPGLPPCPSAHILFTSGSTGVPKGVEITHANVLGFLDWACNYFNINEGERISGHPPLHFDLSTFDIFGSLTRGATLYMVPPRLNLLAPKLAAFIRENGLNQFFAVPSLLTYLAKFDVVRQDDFSEMSRLLWCGEVMPVPTLRYWMRRLPHVTFTNLYGPTEATIASTFYTMPAIPDPEVSTIPLGHACAGEDVLIMDDGLNEAAIGSTGEICIAGSGLSPGYWQDEVKTNAAFVTRPGADGGDERIYRTGDLGHLGEDGLLHFHGRRDSQIKSRGYRIELGEIEAALAKLDYLQESCIVALDSGDFEGHVICCGYVPTNNVAVSTAQMRKDLSRSIPSYMLPTRWHDYDRLPKNPNGKIDRPAVLARFRTDSEANSPNVAEKVGHVR